MIKGNGKNNKNIPGATTDWDRHWEIAIKMMLRPIRNRIVWSMYRPLVDAMEIDAGEEFSVLELAVGEGYITAKMLERFGGHAHGIDSSPYSIHLAEEVFRHFGLTNAITLTMADILTEGDKLLKEQYFLVHSEGLVEHYSGEDKKRLFKIHRDMSRKYVIIFTPRPSPLYYGVRAFFTAMGKWIYPDECPMAVAEIIKIGKGVGMRPVSTTKHVWENGVLFRVD